MDGDRCKQGQLGRVLLGLLLHDIDQQGDLYKWTSHPTVGSTSADTAAWSSAVVDASNRLSVATQLRLAGTDSHKELNAILTSAMPLQHRTGSLGRLRQLMLKLPGGASLPRATRAHRSIQPGVPAFKILRELATTTPPNNLRRSGGILDSSSLYQENMTPVPCKSRQFGVIWIQFSR